MRLHELTRAFHPGRYLKARQDFRDPMQVLMAASGASRRDYSLSTRDGHVIHTNRGDRLVWEQYFSPRGCRVEIDAGLFHVYPDNPAHPAYFIAGGHDGMSHRPDFWNPAAGEVPLLQSLAASERSWFSQHGEDGVVEFLLQRIPVQHGFVVEFGAHDGVSMSNSRHWIHHRAWSGFLIEGNPDLYRKLKVLYADNPRVGTREAFVTPENVDALFREGGVPHDFELLSIDIDSIDYQVWEGLTEFQPKIVIVEFNSMIPPDREYVVPADRAVELGGTSRQGASLLSYEKLGRSKGYRLAYCESAGSNLFFVHESCAGFLDGSGFGSDLVYRPPGFGQLAGSPAPNGRGYL